MNNPKTSPTVALVTSLLLLTASLSVMAANPTQADSAVFWNLVIAIIVLAATLASAALPLAALRQWPAAWRIAAIAPLAVLGLWIAVIVLSRLTDSNSHRLWPFEIFSWAMLNMIYMVAVMTYKRQLDKADQEKRDQLEKSPSDQAS